ncbi:hypothetical protein B0J14DRAFT_659201 [Halenospora varia]|nr:hypothetical protein B0J14DRAFT_659201 [Halenospora varia]
MLFGKVFLTTFTFAAMAISHVACAPTAQPETAVMEKRTSVGDRMNQCYHDVQTHCNDIDNTIDQHGGFIDVELAVEVETKLLVIVDLLVKLCVDLKGDIDLGVSADDINNCGNTFILLVNLLVTVLLKIFNSCQSGAVAILVSVVLKLQVQIQLCASLILGCINGLIGGLLSIILNLLLNLKVDIDACISAFLNACGKFH